MGIVIRMVILLRGNGRYVYSRSLFTLISIPKSYNTIVLPPSI